jgi:AcrR family transcriptional regulator
MTEDENRRDAIINAALEVFGEVGYARASIKMIGTRAGLKSPALIYWYFENKEALLRAVLSSVSPFIALAAASDEVLDTPPALLLPMLTAQFQTVIQNPKTTLLMRVFIAEAIHNADSMDVLVAGAPLMILDFLRRYFTRQIELGNLRPHNPETSARMYMGSLLVYLFGKAIVLPVGETAPPFEDYARDMVDIFLRGLIP